MECEYDQLAVEIATDILLERIPGAVITGVRFHEHPTQREDALLLVNAPMRAIVFDLADGTQRVESWSCHRGDASRSEFAEVCAIDALSPRPTELLFSIDGAGPLQRAVGVDAGRYRFRWWVTAGDTACRTALSVDGGTGPVVLDHDVEVVPDELATGGRDIASLEAGDYSVTLDTDCPGRSSLEMWRLPGLGPGDKSFP